MTASPDPFTRRSFVQPRLIAAGAEFEPIHDTAIAARYPQAESPALGLVDLSPLPRTGVKGPNALPWLAEQGWPVPQGNNRSVATVRGGQVLRLGDREALILPSPDGDGAAEQGLEQSIPGNGAWPMPRRDSHAWFILRGDTAVACLAKLCGVDLREVHFPAGTVAQTSVARLNTIVCRHPAASAPTFHLLADSASALWFWDALLDAMQEFSGGPMGIRELD